MYDIGYDEIPLADPNANGNIENIYLHVIQKGTPSEPLKLDSYFTEYIESVYNTLENKIDFTKEKPLSKILESQSTDLKNEDWEKYSEILSIKKLKSKHGHCSSTEERDMAIYGRYPPKEGVANLHSLKYINSKYAYKSNHYKDKFWITPPEAKSGENDLKPMTDIVLTIRVFKPSDKVHNFGGSFCRLLVNQEVQVLGSQLLTKLRDIITCPNDYVKICNYAQKSNTDSIPYAKDLCKSGFFYFGKTFYNDMRDPTNIDLSEVIRSWKRKATSNMYFGSETAKMEDTKFSSLTVQYGYPYVYQHQGSCEHIIVFTSTRLISNSDELNSKCYPMYTTPFKETNINCFMCGVYPAAWLTQGVTRVPHDPGLFCAECFRLFNFDERGKRVEEFSAHPFFQDKPINEIELDLFKTEDQKPKCAKKEESVIECPPRLFADKGLLGYDGNSKTANSKTANKISKPISNTCKNAFPTAPANVLSRILDNTVNDNYLASNDFDMPSTSASTRSSRKKLIPSKSKNTFVDTSCCTKTAQYVKSTPEISDGDDCDISSSDSDHLPGTLSDNSSSIQHKKKGTNKSSSLAKVLGYKQVVLKLPQIECNAKKTFHRKNVGETAVNDEADAEKKKKEEEKSKAFYAHLGEAIASMPPLKTTAKKISAVVDRRIKLNKTKKIHIKKVKKAGCSTIVTRSRNKNSASKDL